MKMFNVWKSDLSGSYYPMDLEWRPEYDGYTFVGVMKAKSQAEAHALILDKKIKFNK